MFRKEDGDNVKYVDWHSKAELIEQRLLEAQRVSARKKLSVTEKELSEVIYEQTGGNQNFALIRSKGDQALFNKTTQAMKAQWKVPDNRPLADFAPTIILKAKDFATEITIFNARQHQMASESAISQEHVTNNQAVRNTLLERGIRPESLPAAEDVKKVERRIASEDKKALKNPEIAKKLSAQGIEIVGGSSESARVFIDKQIDTWAKVVKDNGIKAD